MGADEVIPAAEIDRSAWREVIAAAEIEVRKCAGGSLLAAGGDDVGASRGRDVRRSAWHVVCCRLQQPVRRRAPPCAGCHRPRRHGKLHAACRLRKIGNRHVATQLRSSWRRCLIMRTNLFDQLGKKIALRALEPSGRTAAQHEIHAHARHADLRHEPDPAREAERARLGLLGRLASVPCLIELFSSTPGEDKVLDCVGKLIAFRQDFQREAARRRRRDPGPAPPLIKPCLWIITAGRPSLGIDMLGAVPDDVWPRGVYLTPALEAGRRPGTRGVPGGMRVGFVVAGESAPRARDDPRAADGRWRRADRGDR
ncbi:MAG: hypothetical protein QM820_20545 [Minicystis sp.]